MSGDYDPPTEKLFFALQCYNCNSWQDMQLDYVGSLGRDEHDSETGEAWWTTYKKYIGTCPNCQCYQEIDVESEREEV